jgi:hypothetical protein
VLEFRPELAAKESDPRLRDIRMSNAESVEERERALEQRAAAAADVEKDSKVSWQRKIFCCVRRRHLCRRI